jgi:thymidylate synthase
MMAQVCGLEPGEFVWTGGDCHLYLNHLDQAREQIAREPLELPRLRLDPSVIDIDGFTGEHIVIEGYEHHPHIAAPISV